MSLPTLDLTVLDTLDFFTANPPPSLDLSTFNLPFVVGSGNAINTGKILFSGKAATFADESNFKSIVASYQPVIDKGLITDAIVISASGEKDSVWEVELAREKGLKTTLLTCKPNSSAAKIADTVLAYKSIAEPYTYNTSTYLGMILSGSGERPEDIKSLIAGLEVPAKFKTYASYAFVLADAFLDITPMLEVKGHELFGPHLNLRAFSEGHARHAKFIHRWKDELVISIGVHNEQFGDPAHRWQIPMPQTAGFGAFLALTYYVCGLIQKAKPDYFMQNIEKYCTDYGPKAYGKTEPFEVIVPAND
jgi:hypothetical protein